MHVAGPRAARRDSPGAMGGGGACSPVGVQGEAKENRESRRSSRESETLPLSFSLTAKSKCPLLGFLAQTFMSCQRPSCDAEPAVGVLAGPKTARWRTSLGGGGSSPLVPATSSRDRLFSAASCTCALARAAQARECFCRWQKNTLLCMASIWCTQGRAFSMKRVTTLTARAHHP